MHDTPRPRRRLPVRLLAAAGLALALLPAGRARTGDGPGGAPADPPSRVPLRTGAAPAEQPEAAPVLRPEDLGRAAAQAPAAVAALYRALAHPDADSKTPYEELALQQVAEFLQAPTGGLRLAEKLRAAETALEVVLRFHLSTRDQLPAGADLEARLRQQLLDVRLRRLRALAAGARREQGWADVLALAGRLVRTYPQSAAGLTQAARVRTAYAASCFLVGDYRTARAQVEWVEGHFLRTPRFRPLRVLWLWHPDVAAVRRALRHKAQALLDEARALPDDRTALGRLQQARTIWPDLPGLQDALLRRQNAYPILHVGVHSLPELLSPATARTDPERQAVELIFESLVRGRYDDAHGQRFVPQLAAGPPEAVPGGRRFRLARGAHWSNGEHVTSADVRDTVQLLKSPTLPGRTPEWADLVEDPLLEDDPFRIDFKFRQSFFAPLLPLTFKVLPQRFGDRQLRAADDREFGRNPVGSGPYRYLGRRHEDGRTCAVFAANPYYRRGGHTDRPYIREVRFHVSADPARDFRDPARPLHLLLDLPSARVRPLQQAGVKDVRTLRNRRVWFLAVNHRVPALADQNLRRAFAHALDREKILTYRFRGGEPAHRLLGVTGGVAALATLDLRRDAHPEFHRPVNGPYPPGSWACCPPPQVPADLFEPDRARAFAREAKAKLPAVELTLKYADDDPRAAEACRDIAGQLTRLGAGVGWAVRIKVLGLPPRKLSEALEKRDYELAYHHLDHASEVYWIWPLFDGRPEALQPGGANFLGYEDAALEGLFRTAMGQRGFAEVRRLTHEIHAHLYERMPLIPLWQLDTHVALHPALRPTALDPLLIFDDVAEWKVEK